MSTENLTSPTGAENRTRIRATWRDDFLIVLNQIAPYAGPTGALNPDNTPGPLLRRYDALVREALEMEWLDLATVNGTTEQKEG